MAQQLRRRTEEVLLRSTELCNLLLVRAVGTELSCRSQQAAFCECLMVMLIGSVRATVHKQSELVITRQE